MGLIVIIAGIALILVSGSVTRSSFKKNLPLDGLSNHEKADLMEASAGSGAVPAWVSAMNLLGWAIVVIGVIALIAG